MAVQKDVRTASFEAGGTIGQYEPVKLTSANTVIVAAADSDLIVGVSQIDATSGEEVSVAIGGITLMRVGTNGVTLNTTVGLDAADPTEIDTYASGDNDQIVGIAQATGVANDLVPVLLTLNAKTA